MLIAAVPWERLLEPDTLFWVGAFSVGVIMIIVNGWRNVERHKADVELKRDMVARGMSVEEIERVLVARSLDCSKRKRW